MPPHLTNTSLNLTQWNDRLALDIALVLEGSGDTVDNVLEEHNLTKEDLANYNKDPLFLRRVSELRADVREKGLTFRLKARLQAEELLQTSWDIIHDVDTSAAVKADLIKSTVKWAGYETKDPSEIAGGGGGVKITINLGPTAPNQPPSAPTTIDVTPSNTLNPLNSPD